ncbi:hypothetical protein ACFSO9_15165 [Mesonia maritima]|uniref:immunoglobulin domain-containing protein n=1 Tax=Mesonia maritima TaxID=1793873 RepID=UPI003631113B
MAISTLPYNTSDDTANYGDPFSGAPGTSCGTTENYLNGNNVVYQYTATDTEVVDILMSNLNDFYAAVFVYGSCADVGVTCLAGAVAGPSDDDFGIRDFQMTAGEEYYIVVSSWLIPTYDYTLDIIPFSCSNLAAPDADSPQDFVTGDEIGDLVVDTNRPGATLNYYSDAAATTVVNTTDPLVDGVTYYVTQSYEGCESAPVAITVSEIDCTSLAITNSTGDSVSCKGEMTLTATASGTGSDIYWYDAATDGNLVGVGNTFDTPVLTNTTSYWVTEVFYQNYNLSQANGLNDWTYGFGSSSNNYGIEFTADKKFVLSSVEVFSTSDAGGNLTVELLNDSGAVINTADFTMPSGGSDSSPIPVTLNLNFEIPSAGTYRLAAADNPDLKYEYDFGNSYVNYPYQLGNVGELTASFSTFTTYDYYYYYFYNWNVIEGEYTCESTPRTEVVATVNQSGDVLVDYTDLDYNTNDSTSLYGNNFQGDPGSDCPGEGYLDGNEVIYEYTADPTNDDILQIELSNITNPNTGMFIYSSCGDIGTSCIEGGTNEDTPFNINISDYYMTAGETIYIVISSDNGATNYTLDIWVRLC